LPATDPVPSERVMMSDLIESLFDTEAQIGATQLPATRRTPAQRPPS